MKACAVYGAPYKTMLVVGRLQELDTAIYSPYAHHTFTICSQRVYHMSTMHVSTICSPYAHHMSTTCLPHVHHMSTTCLYNLAPIRATFLVNMWKTCGEHMAVRIPIPSSRRHCAPDDATNDQSMPYHEQRTGAATAPLPHPRASTSA